MAATEPASLDDWMCSDRLVLDDFAQRAVDKTREALRAAPANEWRSVASRLVNELAHAGHIWSVPICLETSEDGVTYAPFLLPNAKNQCGEADVGILFWLHALQASRQHETLTGKRSVGDKIDDSMAEWYDEEQLAEHNALAADAAAKQPLSVEERRKRAKVALEANPDLALTYADNEADRALVAEALPTSARNPCREPNRMLVLSSDTDFVSLTTVFYAQLCHEQDAQYALDNAPLVCLGEMRVTQHGWLTDYKSQLVPTTAAERKKRKWDASNTGLLAHELFDTHRLYHLLLERLGAKDADATDKLEAALSFALFCAACENDFLAGLYFVNRRHMWEAFLTGGITKRLVVYHAACGAAVVRQAHRDFIKRCYYNSVRDARGAKFKPSKPVADTTYEQMAALVAAKYAKSAKKHMPDKERLHLMFQRSMWWIVYATQAWQGIGQLLDDTTWGWRQGTIDLWV